MKAPANNGRVRMLLGAVLLVLAVAGLATVAHIWGSSQRVGAIRVEGADMVPERSLIARSGVTTGDPLYTVDLYDVRNRLCADPYVKNASVRRDAPDAIVLAIEERRPVAAIASVPMLLLDAEGVILPLPPAGKVLDLPVLSGALGTVGLSPGRRVQTPALLRALELAEVLRTFETVDRRISEIHLTRSDGIVLVTAEGGIPVLTGTDRYQEKLASFKAFWEQVVMRDDVRRLRSVDLRYRGQVIARWSPRGAEG